MCQPTNGTANNVNFTSTLYSYAPDATDVKQCVFSRNPNTTANGFTFNTTDKGCYEIYEAQYIQADPCCVSCIFHRKIYK